MSVIEGIIPDYFCVKVTLVNLGVEKRLYGFGSATRMLPASWFPDGLGSARSPGVIVVVERSRDHHTYKRHQ